MPAPIGNSGPPPPPSGVQPSSEPVPATPSASPAAPPAADTPSPSTPNVDSFAAAPSSGGGGSSSSWLPSPVGDPIANELQIITNFMRENTQRLTETLIANLAPDVTPAATDAPTNANTNSDGSGGNNQESEQAPAKITPPPITAQELAALNVSFEAKTDPNIHLPTAMADTAKAARAQSEIAKEIESKASAKAAEAARFGVATGSSPAPAKGHAGHLAAPHGVLLQGKIDPQKTGADKDKRDRLDRIGKTLGRKKRDREDDQEEEKEETDDTFDEVTEPNITPRK